MGSPAPRIVVSFSTFASPEQVDIVRRSRGDVAEMRLDLYPSQTVDDAVGEAEKFSGIATIVTPRSQAEGGKWRGSEAARLALYRAVLPHVWAVDVELSSEAILPHVILTAHNAGKQVIVSFHDFRQTPPLDQLARIVASGFAHGADWVKVAAWAACREDVRRLAQLILGRDDGRLIVLAMGPIGSPSRIFFPALGSPLAYSHLGGSTAPGQMDYHEMATWFDRFYRT